MGVIRTLQPHPDTPADTSAKSVDSITVAIDFLPGGSLQLIYRLRGRIDALRLPSAAVGNRADGLWRHTCCEAFMRTPDSQAYREFNFSPSTQWQAYVFTDYRVGGLLEPAADPRIGCRLLPTEYILRATLNEQNLPPGAALRLGLSVVIETGDGAISYWALRHPPGKPDFHHPDTFDLELDLT
jgi:hypothetical protein